MHDTGGAKVSQGGTPAVDGAIEIPLLAAEGLCPPEQANTSAPFSPKRNVIKGGMISESLLAILVKHATGMSGTERTEYLKDRGWVTYGRDGLYLRKRDRELMGEQEAILFEMLLEVEGAPTPRSGLIKDPRRGER